VHVTEELPEVELGPRGADLTRGGAHEGHGPCPQAESGRGGANPSRSRS
jgi:hypothetical protein